MDPSLQAQPAVERKTQRQSSTRSTRRLTCKAQRQAQDKVLSGQSHLYLGKDQGGRLRLPTLSPQEAGSGWVVRAGLSYIYNLLLLEEKMISP